MKVTHHVPLAGHTTLHVGGPAATLVELDKDDDLPAAVAQAEKPLWVLGYGANVLVSDKGLPGTVILNHSGKITELSPTRLQVDSGVNWDDFIQYAIAKGLYGLEFTSGIPGGVGAAVAGNIAAYGHIVANNLTEATILDSATGTTKVWGNADLAFEYRGSILQQPGHEHLVVLDATFELADQPKDQLEYESALKIAREIGIQPDSLANRRQIILETRRQIGSLLADQQTGPWSAGSFFKNPLVSEDQVQAIIAHDENGISREQLLRQNKLHSGNSVRVSAAHVLLAAGFARGQSWGNVRLHHDHILKVENTGQATAQEIYNVVQEIIATVQQKIGITISPEVRFLGDFS